MLLDGIDVSHYQSVPDWTLVPGEVGICKATQGAHSTDPTFAANWEAMRVAQRPYRGCYHFLDWTDPGAQAAHFLDTLAAYLPLRAGEFVVLDWENPPGQPPPPDTHARTWIDTVKANLGERVAWYSYYELAKPWRDEFPEPLWLASPTNPVSRSDELGAFLVQYDQQAIDGFAGTVDVNCIVNRTVLDQLAQVEEDMTPQELAHALGARLDPQLDVDGVMKLELADGAWYPFGAVLAYVYDEITVPSKLEARIAAHIQPAAGVDVAAVSAAVVKAFQDHPLHP